MASYRLRVPSAEMLWRVVECFAEFIPALLATGQPLTTVITVEEPPAGVSITMDYGVTYAPPGLLPEHLSLLMAAASVGDAGAVQQLLKAGALGGPSSCPGK